ncbi:MAG: hypothetical protein WBA74_10230, partial [Cyclobacteriaceae bacterium]
SLGGPGGALAGAASVGLAKTIGDPIISTINNMFGTKYTMPTDALEDLFTRIGVAQPKTEAERIVQATAGGIGEAASGVVLGKALQAGGTLAPTVKKGVGQVLASQPLQQIAGGAGSAAAAQTAKEAGAGVVGQTVAGLAGGVGASSLSNLKTTKLPVPPLKEAKKAGVRVMTSDVRPPETFASRFGQSIGEKIPVFGTGLTRQAQQKERISAVKDLIRQYGADDVTNISDDIMGDLLKTRTGKFNQYATSKNEVIKKLSGKVVPVKNTLSEIDNQIKKLESLNTSEVQPVIEKLVDWKGAIQEQDLQNIELLRKQLGESFKAPELVNVRSTGEKSLNKIYGALRDDMTGYIREAGGNSDVNKWMVANKQLSSLIGELDSTALKRALDKGEATPELINNVLFSKKKSDVNALYKNLSPTGKASARTAILAKAAENNTLPGSSEISPDKFVNAVKKLGTQTGIFFEGDDLKQVEGLVKVLNITKRAGQAAATPPTGVQAVLPAGAAALASFFGGGLEGFVGAIGTGAGLGGIARAYESKPIRDILIKLPSVSAGSPQEAALYKRLVETVRAVQDTEGE